MCPDQSRYSWHISHTLVLSRDNLVMELESLSPCYHCDFCIYLCIYCNMSLLLTEEAMRKAILPDDDNDMIWHHGPCSVTAALEKCRQQYFLITDISPAWVFILLVLLFLQAISVTASPPSPKCKPHIFVITNPKYSNPPPPSESSNTSTLKSQIPRRSNSGLKKWGCRYVI